MRRNLSAPRAIIFDWDNTLVESWQCIQVAINATLKAMGHDEWDADEVRRRVALSLRDSFPEMFGERWTEARDIFYETFASIHLDYLTPVVGAREMLESLAQLGLRLAVVSNKNGVFLRDEAHKLGWDSLFDRLVGATDAVNDKPAAAPVLMALGESGIVPGEQVWIVGDSPVDMECAINTGCVPVLLRSAPIFDGEFDEFPPARHLVHCEEVVDLVRELLVPIS